jgi:hypothetical protein
MEATITNYSDDARRYSGAHRDVTSDIGFGTDR